MYFNEILATGSAFYFSSHNLNHYQVKPQNADSFIPPPIIVLSLLEKELS